MRKLSAIEILHVHGGASAGENPQSDPLRDTRFNQLLEQDLFEEEDPAHAPDIDEHGV